MITFWVQKGPIQKQSYVITQSKIVVTKTFRPKLFQKTKKTPKFREKMENRKVDNFENES